MFAPGGHGYWGVPTSSVDWCEANYAHSYYVCEWYNTLSSAAMVLVGAVGVLWHWRVLELRFLLVFASVALVGLGSVAFHGTLLFELQMLDELPMLYTATLLAYILIEDQKKSRFGLRLKLALIAYVVFATYGAAFTRDAVQFWFFQFTFTTLEFFALYRTYRLYRASRSPELRRLFRWGLSFYLSAMTLWFIDLNFCSELVQAFGALNLPNPELHAWWHVLVSCGFYALILVIAHERLVVLGHAPRWVRRAGIITLATESTERT